MDLIFIKHPGYFLLLYGIWNYEVCILLALLVSSSISEITMKFTALLFNGNRSKTFAGINGMASLDMQLLQGRQVHNSLELIAVQEKCEWAFKTGQTVVKAQ